MKTSLVVGIIKLIKANVYLVGCFFDYRVVEYGTHYTATFPLLWTTPLLAIIITFDSKENPWWTQ